MSRKNRRQKQQTNTINFMNYLVEKRHVARPTAKTPGQQNYLDVLNGYQYKIVVALGPAGTGKTMLATERAIERLQKKEIEKVIVTRPASSVDEEIGFLPGDLNRKMEPWMRPILDVFENHYMPNVVEDMMKRGTIEIAPLAFMRGRTFKDAFIIGDEMQNSTPSQMKMLMTRLGKGSQMVITGDTMQSDRMVGNGLVDFKRQYEKYFNAEYVKFVELTKMDIQRHPAVAEVLGIYGE
jgi:phosphate starvation-inducible protein PhoH and related proteins